LKPFNCKVSLQHAWFSGFCEADAGFYTNVNQSFRGPASPRGDSYVKFLTKFYITQRDETAFLTEIKYLVRATNQIYTITNGATPVRYNRLEIYKSESITLLIQYFSQFPLKGIRKIDLLRWARVHAYKNMHMVATEAAGQKLARLLSNLQEPNVEVPLSTYAQNFSEEEKKIFMDLPLNQRHPNSLTRKQHRRSN